MMWKELRNRTFEEFVRLRQCHFVVHDRDLVQIAMTVAEEIGIENFKVY